MDGGLPVVREPHRRAVRRGIRPADDVIRQSQRIATPADRRSAALTEEIRSSMLRAGIPINREDTTGAIKDRADYYKDAARDLIDSQPKRDPREILRSLYFWIAKADEDPWSSLDAFHDLVGRYREVGIEEFIIDHPRPDQEEVFEQVAAELPALRRSSL